MSEKYNGYEKELNIDVPTSVKPYVSAVYGIEKQLDELLSFKVGKVCKDQLMDYVERMIYYAILAGMQQQKEINNAVMMDMQRQLDILIKRDGKAAKERKEKVGC